VSLHYLVKYQCFKATTENKTISVGLISHCKKLTTENNLFIVSVIVQSNCHISQFLHQMFNVLPLDDALKPATPLIKTQPTKCCDCSTQWQSPASAGCLTWMIDIDRPSFERHSKQHNRPDLSPGCLGATDQASSTLITPIGQCHRQLECNVWHFTR